MLPASVDFDELLQNLFVGRDKEQGLLKNKWNAIKNMDEHLIHVLLNAPGVGKTTLLQYFGKCLEQEKEGLFLFYQASDNLISTEVFNSNIFNFIYERIRESQNLIDEYLALHQADMDYRLKMTRKQELPLLLETLVSQKQVNLNDLYKIMKLLSSIIPIFFVTDEIQEFQKITILSTIDPHAPNPEKETGLHYYTRFLKDLLRLPILILLSGTRYHILSQIGDKIGSPIRQKVRSIVLSKFSLEDIQEYVNKISAFFDSSLQKMSIQDPIQLNLIGKDLLHNYHQFLLGFSGGHPRTIAYITELFFTNLSVLFTKDDYRDYSIFTRFFLPIVEKTIGTSIFTSEIQDHLQLMASNRHFGTIKEWLINGAYLNNQFLGSAPKDIQSPATTEIWDKMIYDLMNIGLIVQNGQLNYYITSYFHFLAFISIFSGPHEDFLRNVLYNQYFQVLCGSHGGFGFVFEHILAVVLFQVRDEKISSLFVPFFPSRIRKIQTITTQPDWNSFIIEPDLLYHFPWAKTIDFCIFQKKTLLLIQITTSSNPSSDKIIKMQEIEQLLANNAQISINSSKPIDVHCWFLSLYSIKPNVKYKSNMTVSSGDDLIPILGQELYDRLKAVKQYL